MKNGTIEHRSVETAAGRHSSNLPSARLREPGTGPITGWWDCFSRAAGASASWVDAAHPVNPGSRNERRLATMSSPQPV